MEKIDYPYDEDKETNSYYPRDLVNSLPLDIADKIRKVYGEYPDYRGYRKTSGKYAVSMHEYDKFDYLPINPAAPVTPDDRKDIRNAEELLIEAEGEE